MVANVATNNETNPVYTPENGLRGFLGIVLLLTGLRYTGLF